MLDLNEFQTRKLKIDILLQEQGWDISNRTKILLEVDTKQSNFKKQVYKQVNETRINDSESKYADYLLLDKIGSPLAIIEAKRTVKDALTGQKQAEEYADDIKAQTGKDVFIFLSNGYEIWFWDRERYGVRQIRGFYSQDDLERLSYQRKNSESEPEIDIDGSIVDRAKSIEVATRVIEHIHRGHRKALIVMATGTGKTRVAMAIIDQLMREERVQRVLFLTDRITLRDQAIENGFMKFFKEEAKQTDDFRNYDPRKRFYAYTIQTFHEIYTQKDKKGKYIISPGTFDLVFSDEAHRSIYSKWKGVFNYLDAIQIGLTATPADMVDRDTFRFFECEGDIPTALYSYEDAVRDGVLCDFRKNISGARTHFQLEGIKPQDLTEGEREELLNKGIDPDEINFEGTELEKKVAVKGTSEAIVREFMDNCLMDQTGNLPAKTIFFAISKAHAKRLWEAFEKLYPEYKGRLARRIISEDQEAQKLIKSFKTESFPRIAISVDMMDTGIDVPEVCNLVFAKPVFSKIKFWQMLGRGTRADGACEHREWLPEGKKEYFKVFDFWNNFEYWNMNPEGVKNESPEAIANQIFLVRLKQLKRLMQHKDPASVKAAKQVKTKIISDIELLPRDSVSICEHSQDVEKALSPKLWDNIAIDPVDFLQKKIMPLMKFKPDVNLKEATFTLRCEKLAYALLENDKPEVERLKTSIAEMVDRLPRTLDAVRAKESLMDNVLSRSFWETISFEDVQLLLSDLSPLMPYIAKEPRETIVIDMSDIIAERKEWNLDSEKQPAYVEAYNREIEARIKELAETHPSVQKIKNNELLTEYDLEQLEETLLNVNFVDGNLRNVESSVEYKLNRVNSNNSKNFNSNNQDRRICLVNFIRQVLGLYSSSSPDILIKNAFQNYISENNKSYSADQLNFIITLQTVFLKKKHIEYFTLWQPPFTNFGTTAPMPMFTQEELNSFINICNRVEKDLFM